jgi:hypothetical protein
MSKVYVIQSTRTQADVSPAASYGDIVFILTVADRTSCDPDSSLQKLRKGLEGFDEHNDYLLWSGGDPLSFMLVGWLLAEWGVPSIRYLRYERGDARKGKSSPFYVPVTVTFPDED